jgi:hypothetical protein
MRVRATEGQGHNMRPSQRVPILDQAARLATLGTMFAAAESKIDPATSTLKILVCDWK